MHKRFDPLYVGLFCGAILTTTFWLIVIVGILPRLPGTVPPPACTKQKTEPSKFILASFTRTKETPRHAFKETPCN